MAGEVRGRLDKQVVRRAFDRRAPGYLAGAQVQGEIGRRMLERLDLIRLDPAFILDVGCGPGVTAQALAQRFPRSKIIALDLSQRMLEQIPRQNRWQRWWQAGFTSGIAAVCADFEKIPLAPASVDCVVSNLALPWCSSIPAVIAELNAALRPGGLLMFTTMGPDTLKELRHKASPLSAHLADMHDLGDALVHQGFSGPVMDQEHLHLTYSGVRALLRDVRAWGAVDMSADRVRHLVGPGRVPIARTQTLGKPVQLTLEVVYGHAWKGAPASTSRGTNAVIRFDRALRKG